jgi:spermidine/putrescine-binding protein
MQKKHLGWAAAAVVFIVIFGAIALVILSNAPLNLNVLAEDVATGRAYEAISAARPSVAQHVTFQLKQYDDLNKLADQDFINGAGVYDVVLNYNTAAAKYTIGKYILPIDQYDAELRRHGISDFSAQLERIKNDVFENVWKEIGSYYKNGAYTGNAQPTAVAIPFAANTMVLAYNSALFQNEGNRSRYKAAFNEELAPPDTWEKFHRIAKFLFEANHGSNGLCLQGAESFNYYEWANFLYSTGGSIAPGKKFGWQGNASIRYELSSPAVVQATRHYLSLKPFIARQDYFSTDEAKQVECLRQNDASMAIVWSDVLFDLHNQAPGKYQYTVIPGTASMIAGGGFYVSARSKHKAEAIEYILDMFKPAEQGDDAQTELLRKGLCPPTRSPYRNKDIRKDLPYVDSVYESLNRGTYMLEAGPEADGVILQLSTMLQGLWRKADANGDVTGLEDMLSWTEAAIRKHQQEMYRSLDTPK